MEALASLAEFVLHVDRALADLVARYGGWTYAITFLIVFCETGLVVTPFLPGDSLLFAAGTLAAVGALDPHLLVALLTVAAVVGDAVNYTVATGRASSCCSGGGCGPNTWSGPTSSTCGTAT